jgi:hypothetical protein
LANLFPMKIKKYVAIGLTNAELIQIIAIADQALILNRFSVRLRLLVQSQQKLGVHL